MPMAWHQPTKGKLDEAAACCRRALALNPDFAEAHNNLAAVVGRQEKWDEAVACLSARWPLKPDYANAHVEACQRIDPARKAGRSGGLLPASPGTEPSAS